MVHLKDEEQTLFSSKIDNKMLVLRSMKMNCEDLLGYKIGNLLILSSWM